MSGNPFNDSMDWALRGKYARVHEDETTYEGWIERVHHSRGSVIMHDVTVDGDKEIASVFVRTPEVVEVIKPQRTVEWRPVDELQPHPNHDVDFEPRDATIRSCYRNQFAEGYPVVRTDGTIINGHKRVEAARIAGLDRHPVEVIDVTEEQADELFAVAHRSHMVSKERSNDEEDAEDEDEESDSE